MKTIYTLLILILLILPCSSSYAQCDFPEGDFEEWVDITQDYTDALPEGSLFIPENVIPFTRLFNVFFIQGLVQGLLEVNTDPSIISQILLGIERVEDASSGQYALKMTGDTLSNSSDIWIIGECSDRPNQLSIDFKHIGSTYDTVDVIVLIGNSSDVPGFDENNQFIDDDLSTFASGRIVINENIEDYQRLTLELTNTNNDVQSDTAMVIIFAGFEEPAEGEEYSHFILDNVRFVGNSTSTNEMAKIEGIEVYPTITQDAITFKSSEEEINSYRIISQDGKIGIHQSVNSYNETINVSNLPSGTYFLQLQAGRNYQTKRFIKL